MSTSTSAPQEPVAAPSPTPDAPKRYLEPPTDQPANNLTPGAVPTLAAAASMIRLDDFKTVHTKPCFREANLWGMGTGFAFGGARFVLRGTPTTAAAAAAYPP